MKLALSASACGKLVAQPVEFGPEAVPQGVTTPCSASPNVGAGTPSLGKPGVCTARLATRSVRFAEATRATARASGVRLRSHAVDAFAGGASQSFGSIPVEPASKQSPLIRLVTAPEGRQSHCWFATHVHVVDGQPVVGGQAWPLEGTVVHGHRCARAPLVLPYPAMSMHRPSDDSIMLPCGLSSHVWFAA